MSITMNRISVLALSMTAFTLLPALPAAAQNTSSVSSPGVDAGERGVEYRFGWTPGENGRDDSFAHRFDYAHALNERQGVKAIAVIDDKPGRDARLNYVGGEFIWEVTPEDARVWQSALRVDGRISNGSTPEQIGFDWINRWTLSPQWHARAMVATSKEFGDRADDSIGIEARASLNYNLGGGYKAALLSFNKLGTLDDFGTDGQRQQLGPTLSGPLGNGWGWTVGNLFGVSDAAPDNDVRLWLSRDF